MQQVAIAFQQNVAIGKLLGMGSAMPDLAGSYNNHASSKLLYVLDCLILAYLADTVLLSSMINL